MIEATNRPEYYKPRSVQDVCAVIDCNNLQATNGRDSDGTRRYRHTCNPCSKTKGLKMVLDTPGVSRTRAKRQECEVEGCSNLQQAHGSYVDGTTRWAPRCHKHSFVKENHRKGEPRKRDVRSQLPANCQVCGWSEAVCDVHRITPGAQGGLYTRENCVMLCPNHHRLATLGLLNLESYRSWNHGEGTPETNPAYHIDYGLDR